MSKQNDNVGIRGSFQGISQIRKQTIPAPETRSLAGISQVRPAPQGNQPSNPPPQNSVKK